MTREVVAQVRLAFVELIEQRAALVDRAQEIGLELGIGGQDLGEERQLLVALLLRNRLHRVACQDALRRGGKADAVAEVRGDGDRHPERQHQQEPRHQKNARPERQPAAALSHSPLQNTVSRVCSCAAECAAW
jgi:hypothetical protein